MIIIPTIIIFYCIRKKICSVQNSPLNSNSIHDDDNDDDIDDGDDDCDDGGVSDKRII